MKKRFTCLSMVLILLTTLVMPAMASDAPTVVLDGKVVAFDVSPMIQDGRVLVPMGAIFEAMGAQVSWDGAAGQAKAVKDGITVIIPINSTSPTINGVVKTLDVPAQIVDGRTLVPLGFVGLAFGCIVSWDSATGTVAIKSPTLPKTVVYKTYENNCIGFSLPYPDIFATTEEIEKGNGIAMKSADGLYNLKMWAAMNNVKMSSGQELLAEAKNRVAHITSEYADVKFYRLSYWGGGSGQEPEITFYECGFVSADKVVFFCLSYPSSQETLFTGIVAHMITELNKVSLANG